MASTAVPGLFAPVEIDDKLLVDGGLVDNVPVGILQEQGSDLTIGVDLGAQRTFRQPDDLIDVLINSIDIAIDNATRLQTSKADLVIAPKTGTYSRADSGHVSELIDEGYKAARDEISGSDKLSA